MFFRHLFHSPSPERHLVFKDKGEGRRERMSCPCRMASRDGQPTCICSVSPEAPLPGASRVGLWTVAMTTKVILKPGTWAGCSVLGTSPVGGGSQPSCYLKNPVGEHCLCPSPEDWGPRRGLPALKSRASICFGKQLCSTSYLEGFVCPRRGKSLWASPRGGQREGGERRDFSGVSIRDGGGSVEEWGRTRV